MKTRSLFSLLAGAALTTAAVSAATFTFKQYRALPPVRLHVPATPDTVQKENPFKTSDLLDSRAELPVPANDGWTTMVTDTAGRLSLVNDENAPLLHTYTTRLRADRFAKGKLVLNATARGAVRVDGKSEITKADADSAATDSEARLELLPQRTYEITVDLLAMPDDKSAPEFSLRFVPDSEFEDVTVTGGTDIGQRVSPLTLMQGERGSSVSLSDNGKYLIFTTRETISADETKWRSTLSEAATGKVISEGINTKAQWLPGADAFCYSTAREGKYDIYRTDVPSMRTSLLAKGIPDNNVTFSPEGRYLFYYKQVEADKQSGPMHRYSQPDDRIPQDRDRSYIMRYDTKTHVSIPLTYGGQSTGIYAFTPDGSKMLYGSTRQTPSRYPFYLSTFVQMDMETLRCDTIFKDMEANPSAAVYSPDGRQLFIVAGPSAFGSVGENFAPHEIGNEYDSQGYIYDIATGNVRAMTRDFNPALQSSVVWNRVDNRIYFMAEEGFNRPLYRMDPKSGKIDKLPTEVPFVLRYSIGDDDASRLAYIGDSFTRDGAAYMLDLKNLKSRLIGDPLAEYTKDVKFGEMEQWVFTAKDGTRVDGYMCLPPDFDPQAKYPLIVYYYGGTSPSNATFYHLYSPQVFASRGYVVYVVNPSGTTGYGQEFSARHVNAWGKRTAQEIIDGTKEFCRTHPYVDDKKIGCLGASYGGFMTQYLQTLTDIFTCAVSHAGISNVTSYWGEGYWGYSYNSVAAAKSYPWSDPELFTKQGSLFNADKIHTPLLLLHGTADTNVPIGESIQLFNALKILGREVEFITVQDENHVISGYDNKIIWQNTIMAWFAKWLQDDPRWWNSLYN